MVKICCIKATRVTVYCKPRPMSLVLAYVTVGWQCPCGRNYPTAPRGAGGAAAGGRLLWQQSAGHIQRFGPGGLCCITSFAYFLCALPSFTHVSSPLCSLLPYCVLLAFHLLAFHSLSATHPLSLCWPCVRVCACVCMHSSPTQMPY
jgi:hypothetical protein